MLLYPLYKIGGDEYMDYGLINQCFEKLAMYEDAEEQGLLLRLPITDGTEVYEIIDEFAEKLCDELSEKTTDILVDGFKFDVLTLDGVVDIVWEIAERMKNE